MCRLANHCLYPCPEPPSQVNISSLYFAESGLTQLVCAAPGGVPDSHNITLLHSSQPIATTMGNELQTYIANSLFGEVTCIVETLYSTKRVSLLMQEKGNLKCWVEIFVLISYMFTTCIFTN